MITSVFVRQEGMVCDFASSEPWVILTPIEQSIKRKIEAVGTPLKDWDIQIYRGVFTGCNEAFIISTEKRNEILANCQSDDERKRTDELIRPFYCCYTVHGLGLQFLFCFDFASGEPLVNLTAKEPEFLAVFMDRDAILADPFIHSGSGWLVGMIFPKLV